MNSNIKIIGRTRVNIENYDVDFSKIDYARINELSTQFILGNNIDRLPVDVVSIAIQNSWSVIPYSQISKDIMSAYEEIIYTDWGFTLYFANRYMIFYNDNIKIGSQRFTIVLEHFINSDAETREIEANCFAANILMPINVLRVCRVESAEELSALCGVGYTSAAKRISKMQDKNSPHDNENIEKQFLKFTKEYLNKMNNN